MPKQQCLVLGATGIIGNHIVRELLSQGYAVTALSRGMMGDRNLNGLDVRRIKGDLSDAESLTKAFRCMDWVFHSAGYYPKNAFQSDRHVATALSQTRNVITAALATGIGRLIYTSSLTTIGRGKGGVMADETCAYDMTGRDPHPYFRLKPLLEKEFLDAHLARGLPVVMLNPTGCFGPYEQKPRALCLVPQLKTGKLPGFIEAPINVVNTADVAKGHVSAASRARLGERYILGGHNTVTSAVMREICEVLGVRPPQLKFPLPLALVGALATEGVARLTGGVPAIPALGVRFLQYGQHVSSEKARRELGFAPGPMRPCYETAFEWFREIGYC